MKRLGSLVFILVALTSCEFVNELWNPSDVGQMLSDSRGRLEFENVSVDPALLVRDVEQSFTVKADIGSQYTVVSVKVDLKSLSGSLIRIKNADPSTPWQTNVTIRPMTAGIYKIIIKVSNDHKKQVEYTNTVEVRQQDTIYVSTNGNDIYAGLQQFPMRSVSAAIARAKTKSITNILIAGGVYTNRNSAARCAVFDNVQNIRISGSWNADFTATDISSTPTVIDGLGKAANVVYLNTSTKIVLENMVFTGGYNPNKTGNGGAGVCSVNSSVTIRGCRIVDNNALRYGGGLYAIDSTLSILNSVISRNASVTNSAAFGGGLYLMNSGGTIASNEISKNTTAHSMGGGIYLRYAKTLRIADNTIVSNSAALMDGGGIYIESSSSNVTVLRNRFEFNKTITAGGGSAIGCVGSSPFILENSFLKNHSSDNDNSVYLYNASKPTINGNTFASNGNYSVYEGDVTSDPVSMKNNRFGFKVKYRNEAATDIATVADLNTLFGVSGGDENTVY